MELSLVKQEVQWYFSKFLLENPEFIRTYDLSSCKYISASTVKEYIECFDRNKVCKNTALSIADLHDIYPRNVNMFTLLKRDDLDIETVKMYLDTRGSVDCIALQRCVTVEVFEKYCDKFMKCVFFQTHSPNIELFVTEFPNLHWKWNLISQNKHISSEFVLIHFNENWSVHALLEHIPLSVHLLGTLSSYLVPEFGEELSKNPSITVEIIKEFPWFKWEWCSLSCNKSIDTEFVKAFPDKPWNYEFLASNHNVDPDYICTALSGNIPWQTLCILASHPNLTPEILFKNDHLDWPFFLIELFNSNIHEFIKYFPGMDEDDFKPYSNQYYKPYLDLDEIEWRLIDGCPIHEVIDKRLDYKSSDLMYKLLIKKDQSKHVHNELVQIVLKPSTVKFNLNMYKYNPGTEEY